MRYALALLATLFLAMPAAAQWGNYGVQVVVPVPGGGGVSVGYSNGGYYNTGYYYNPGYYNTGYYYNPGYNTGYNYQYRGGGCYQNNFNGGFNTYNRYPYTPYPSWGGGGGGYRHGGGRGRCR